MRPRVTVHVVMSLDGKVISPSQAGDQYTQVSDWEALQECRYSANVSLPLEFDVIEELKAFEASDVGHVHCEGGGVLLAQLFSEDLVDELFLTWAGNKVVGGVSPTMSSGDFLPQSRQMELVSMDTGGAGECYLRYRKVTE